MLSIVIVKAKILFLYILEPIKKIKINNFIIEYQNTNNKYQIITAIKGLLELCQPQARFSATYASIIHNSKIYQHIIQQMKNFNLWSDDINSLHETSLNISL